jgi:hypothetical protein
MRWLPVTVLAALLPLAAFFACSNGDDSSTSLGTMDASQPPPTKFEAGANCASTDDCETGLVCLFPVGAGFACNALAVCVAQPTCTKSTTACSCLAEPIPVCGGYAENPVDPTATCEAGAIPPEDGGADDAGGGTPDAASDAGGIADAGDAAG